MLKIFPQVIIFLEVLLSNFECAHLYFSTSVDTYTVNLWLIFISVLFVCLFRMSFFFPKITDNARLHFIHLQP